MAEADAANSAEPSASTSKKAVKGKGGAGKKAARVKPSHPKTADMVTAAIKNLKEKGGSSLQAIKKYIGSNYKVDAEKLAPFIRKYLKSAVTSGTLVQTKGKGASGSFKLPTAGDKLAEKKKPSKPAPAKSAEPKAKKPKATPVKKIPAVKKSASSAPVRAPVKAKPKPAPVKAKKAKKPPAKKPKPAKVKKPIAPKAKSPKKSPASKKK